MVTETDWNSVLNCSECPNDLTEKLINTLTILYKKFFPLKIKYISNKRFYKPWLSKAMFNSIRNKHKMYKQTLFGDFDTAFIKNTLKFSMNLYVLAKNQHFKKSLMQKKNDIKKLGNRLINFYIQNIT